MAYQVCGVNDSRFIQQFAISWTNYCRAKNICMAEVFRAVKQEKGVNFDKVKLYTWRKGKISRPVLVYSMNALCEQVGLSILDFVEVKNPLS